MNGLTEIYFGEPEIQLAILILSKIKYLIYKPLKYLHILIGNLHEGLLQRCEIFGLGKHGNRLGNQSERSAQIVRHICEEHQFGLGGDLQLFVEARLFVFFLLEQPVLNKKFFLMTATLPIGSQQQETDAKQQNNNGNACIEQRRLRRMLRPIVIDLGFKQFHLPGFLLQRLILQQENIGIGQVDGG